MSFLLGLVFGLILGIFIMHYFAREFYEEAKLWRQKYHEMRENERV